MKRKMVVVFLFICLSASFSLMMGCDGDGDSNPTAPEEGNCLEVSEGGSFLGLPSWNVSLKDKASGEVLKSFPISFVAACISNSDGEQIACYQNAMVENGELVSFDATIDGEEYSYPEDRC